MNDFVAFLLIVSCFIFTFAWGAVAHEKDMARNYAETGNASAWFYDIKKVSCDE